MRYRSARNQIIPFIRVFKDNEFGTEIQRHPPRDRWWEQIEVIQTAIKSKTGCGTPLFVHFVAPLDEENPNNAINYSYSHFPSDYTLLKNEDDIHYALKQCYIVAEYLQRVRGLELLQMNAEFSKDDNGFIWLFYAKNIFIRKSFHDPGLIAGAPSKVELQKQARKK